MKGDLISLQSIHKRYCSLLNKHKNLGFSEVELREYLQKIGCLQEDYVKTVPIPENGVLTLDHLYLKKRDWKISPKDKPRMDKKLRGEE